LLNFSLVKLGVLLEFEYYDILPYWIFSNGLIDNSILNSAILITIVISICGIVKSALDDTMAVQDVFNRFKTYLIRISILFVIYYWFLYKVGERVFFLFISPEKEGLETKPSFSIFSNMYNIESVTLILCFLTLVVVWLAFFISLKHIEVSAETFTLLVLLIKILLIIIFCTSNLVGFYFLFEFILLPMFLMIGIWGSRDRKVLASLQFFITTLFFSLLFFVAIVFFYYMYGNTSIVFSAEHRFIFIPFEFFLWFFILMSFLVKLPLLPLHFWLPEAHGEASTAGSMILAGILLKLGGYGIYKFLLDFSFIADDLYVYYLFLILLTSAVVSTVVILRQTDFKKLIAYSSVSHMAIVAFGLFSMTYDGIDGAVFLMFSHGLVSSVLFLSVGLLYDRYKTRVLKSFAGLSFFMPMFSFFFMFFIFANMGLPGTSGFIGEFIVFNNLLYSSLVTDIMLFFAFFFNWCLYCMAFE